MLTGVLTRWDGWMCWTSVFAFWVSGNPCLGQTTDLSLPIQTLCTQHYQDRTRTDYCISVRILWLRGISNHGTGGQVSHWGSTIKLRLLCSVTNRCTSWHDLKYYQDLKLQQRASQSWLVYVCWTGSVRWTGCFNWVLIAGCIDWDLFRPFHSIHLYYIYIYYGHVTW